MIVMLQSIADWLIVVGGVSIAAVVGLGWARCDVPSTVVGEGIEVGGFREDAVLAAMAVYLMALLSLSPLVGEVADGGTADGWWANSAAQLIGGVGCLWIAGSRITNGFRPFLFGLSTKTKSSLAKNFLGMTIVALALCPLVHGATVWTILRFDPTFDVSAHTTLRALQDERTSLGVAVGLWAGAVMIAPAAEELFFRGILQNTMLNVTGDRRIAIVLGAVAFGLVHASQPHAILALTFLGVLLGIAYQRTGALIVPIAVHAAFNLKTLVWDAIGRLPTH